MHTPALRGLFELPMVLKSNTMDPESCHDFFSMYFISPSLRIVSTRLCFLSLVIKWLRRQVEIETVILLN